MKKFYFMILAIALITVPAAALTWTVFADTRVDTVSTSASVNKTISAAVKALRLTSSPRASSHNINLSTAQISLGENGKVIVAMDATGDLRGSFTLTIERGSGGMTVVGGYWAMIESYTDLTPLGHPDADGDGEAVNETLIQKGTLSGNISNGTVTLDASGNVTAVDVMLVVENGSVDYADIHQGGGTAQASNLQDTSTSAGSLTLNF